MSEKKINFNSISNELSRDEMKKIMAGSGGWCVPGYACHTQQNCTCSIGFKCCCNGILTGCYTSAQQCLITC